MMHARSLSAGAGEAALGWMFWQIFWGYDSAVNYPDSSGLT